MLKVARTHDTLPWMALSVDVFALGKYQICEKKVHKLPLFSVKNPSHTTSATSYAKPMVRKETRE